MDSLSLDDTEMEHRLQRLHTRYCTVSRLLELAQDEFLAISGFADNGIHLAYAQNRIIQLINVRDRVRTELGRLEESIPA